MLLLSLLACANDNAAPSTSDSGADGSETPAAVVWYGDVEPIVTQACTGCHVAGGVGGFPLDTYASAAPMAEAIASAVEARRMPPWKAAEGCNDYRGDLSLPADRIARLREWADLGAPVGDVADSRPEPPPNTELPRVDKLLELPVA
jgi:hypothetical protein